MSLKNIYPLIAALGLLLLVQPSYAQTASTVRVGVYECPPFVINNGQNSYTGLCLELWRQMAEEMGLEYHVKSFALEDILDAVSGGQLDIGVSCLSITAEREQFVDFSHSFYETHLAIAVHQQGRMQILLNITSVPTFVQEQHITFYNNKIFKLKCLLSI